MTGNWLDSINKKIKWKLMLPLDIIELKSDYVYVYIGLDKEGA